MIVVQFPLKNAQKIKKFILDNELHNRDFLVDKDEDMMYMVVTEDAQSKLTDTFEDIAFVSRKMPKNIREITTLRDVLSSELTKEEMEKLKTAYDQVGDIAILEIDEELRHKEKLIAQTLLDLHKNLKVVVRKEGFHGGKFRTQQMVVLAGEDRKETIHKENGIRLSLNVEEVYFSVRLGTERLRIANQVQKDERILVMFSGCAPYVCVLSKNTRAKEIVGVEWNPLGHEYGVKNIGLNRITNAELHNGDVNTIVPTLGTFDRILMPLPKTAENFLDVALGAAHAGTIIHMYDFLNEAEFDTAKQKIADACARNKKEYELLELVKCGQHAPHVYRICVDFRVH